MISRDNLTPEQLRRYENILASKEENPLMGSKQADLISQDWQRTRELADTLFPPGQERITARELRLLADQIPELMSQVFSLSNQRFGNWEGAIWIYENNRPGPDVDPSEIESGDILVTIDIAACILAYSEYRLAATRSGKNQEQAQKIGFQNLIEHLIFAPDSQPFEVVDGPAVPDFRGKYSFPHLAARVFGIFNLEPLRSELTRQTLDAQMVLASTNKSEMPWGLLAEFEVQQMQMALKRGLGALTAVERDSVLDPEALYERAHQEQILNRFEIERRFAMALIEVERCTAPSASAENLIENAIATLQREKRISEVRSSRLSAKRGARSLDSDSYTAKIDLATIERCNYGLRAIKAHRAFIKRMIEN